MSERNSSAAIDFTSSSFLGYRHLRADLPDWGSFSTGVPAALAEDELARSVAHALAAAQGCPAGLVSRSTLHALSDVLGELPQAGDVVAIDEFAYPISQWAALRARAKGAVVQTYPHHRPVRCDRRGRLFLVTDGWCAGCGQPAPLQQLQRMAARTGGQVIVDDTFACGVLGRRSARPGFGDGSGTVRWLGLTHASVLWVASLSKALASPIAVITGDQASISRLRRAGTRWHSSPPSAADLRAAAHAVHDRSGAAARRAVLHRRVQTVREAVRAAGLPVTGPPFPLVRVPAPSTAVALDWQRHLSAAGIETVVQRPPCRPGSQLAILIRADHQPFELRCLAARIGDLADLAVEVSSR